MLRYLSPLCRLPNGRTCSKLVPILARALSTGNTSNLPNSKSPDNLPSSTNETLSLLHRTITLLPQALNSSSSTRAEETANFWNGILSNVYEDLSPTTKKPARIVGPCTPNHFTFDGCLSSSQYVA